jgi:hypothetical protein
VIYAALVPLLVVFLVVDGRLAVRKAQAVSRGRTCRKSTPS